jgi:predicted small metal-binding protein
MMDFFNCSALVFNNVKNCSDLGDVCAVTNRLRTSADQAVLDIKRHVKNEDIKAKRKMQLEPIATMPKCHIWGNNVANSPEISNYSLKEIIAI